MAGRNISAKPLAMPLAAANGSLKPPSQVNGTKSNPSASNTGVYLANNKPVRPMAMIEGKIAAAIFTPAQKCDHKIRKG